MPNMWRETSSPESWRSSRAKRSEQASLALQDLTADAVRQQDLLHEAFDANLAKLRDEHPARERNLQRVRWRASSPACNNSARLVGAEGQDRERRLVLSALHNS